jgi:sugar lactone lactonase YvrE
MTHRFATAEKTVLPEQRAHVFFDGIFTEPRLQHAECVAIGPDGHVWCGSENGEVLRIPPDGSRCERRSLPTPESSASTAGGASSPS